MQFGIVEASQRQIESGVGQLGQFDRQQFLVPTGVERQTVVGNDVRALLRRRQVRQLDHRHVGQAQLACGRQTSVARDDTLDRIHQDRRGPAELGNAGGDLGDLRIAVRARIAGVGDQRLDLAVLDVERVHADAGPENEKPADESRGGWSGIE